MKNYLPNITQISSRGKALAFAFTSGTDKYEPKIALRLYTYDDHNKKISEAAFFLDIEDALALAHMLSTETFEEVYLDQIKKTPQGQRGCVIKKAKTKDGKSIVSFAVTNGDLRLAIAATPSKAQSVGLYLKEVLKQYISETAKKYFFLGEKKPTTVYSSSNKTTGEEDFYENFIDLS